MILHEPPLGLPLLGIFRGYVHPFLMIQLIEFHLYLATILGPLFTHNPQFNTMTDNDRAHMDKCIKLYGSARYLEMLSMDFVVYAFVQLPADAFFAYCPKVPESL